SFYASLAHRHLHSFPTRRSSDLTSPSWKPANLRVCSQRLKGTKSGSLCFRMANSPSTKFGVCSGFPPRHDSIWKVRNERHCRARSEEHTSELQSRFDLVCRLLLE